MQLRFTNEKGPEKRNMEARLSSVAAACEKADIQGWVGVGDGMGVEHTVCLPTFWLHGDGLTWPSC